MIDKQRAEWLLCLHAELYFILSQPDPEPEPESESESDVVGNGAGSITDLAEKVTDS